MFHSDIIFTMDFFTFEDFHPEGKMQHHLSLCSFRIQVWNRGDILRMLISNPGIQSLHDTCCHISY